MDSFPAHQVTAAAGRDPESDLPAEPDAREAAGALEPRGAHLHGIPAARTEGAIAIDAVLRRFPEMRLTTPAQELRWWPSAIMRGLYELPVTIRRQDA